MAEGRRGGGNAGPKKLDEEGGSFVADQVSSKIIAFFEERGISRRDFLKLCGVSAAALGLSPLMHGPIAEALAAAARRPSLVWLDFQECLGCTESTVKAVNPGPAQLLLNILSADYWEAIMAPAGFPATADLEDQVKKGGYICVVEGAIPTRIPQAMTGGTVGTGEAAALRLGPTALETANRVCKRAAAVVCAGTCSSYGGVQAAAPNPTGAKGVQAAIGVKTVNLPGCPVNPVWIVTTVVHNLLFKRLPALDAHGRPKFIYGQLNHNLCPRRAHFDAGEFVEQFGTTAEARHLCLYKLGCKGPATYTNCPLVLWNDRQSWCIGAGAPCIGCTEPDFWDRMMPFYSRLENVPVPGFLGVEVGADRIGSTLFAATVTGAAIHAGVTAVKRRRRSREQAGQGKDREGGEER